MHGVVSLSCSYSSSSCGFCNPPSFTPTSPLIKPAPEEIHGERRDQCGRGGFPCAWERCHIPPCSCPTCSPQVWSEPLLPLYSTFFPVSLCFRCKAHAVCKHTLSLFVLRRGVFSIQFLRFFFCIANSKGIWALPGFRVINSICCWRNKLCCQFSWPILTVLDRPVDCESCGCHIKQEDTRQGIQPLFELALCFTEQMDYADLCFVISCIWILARVQKNHQTDHSGASYAHMFTVKRRFCWISRGRKFRQQSMSCWFEAWWLRISLVNGIVLVYIGFQSACRECPLSAIYQAPV